MTASLEFALNKIFIGLFLDPEANCIHFIYNIYSGLCVCIFSWMLFFAPFKHVCKSSTAGASFLNLSHA